MNDEIRHTAIHEAGHVIAFWIFEEAVPEGFKSVTIKPDDENGYLAAVTPNKRLNQVDPSLFSFEDSDEFNREIAKITQRELEAYMCISLAGEAATYIESGERDDIGAGRHGEVWVHSENSDFANCMDYLVRIFEPWGDDSKTPESQASWHYLEALFWRTVLLLQRPVWHKKLERLVEALLERKTMTAQECVDVCYEKPDWEVSEALLERIEENKARRKAEQE